MVHRKWYDTGLRKITAHQVFFHCYANKWCLSELVCQLSGGVLKGLGYNNYSCVYFSVMVNRVNTC